MQLAVAESRHVQTVVLHGLDFEAARACHADVLAFNAFDLLLACTRSAAGRGALGIDQKGIAVNVFHHAMRFVMRGFVFSGAPTDAVGAHHVIGFDEFEI